MPDETKQLYGKTAVAQYLGVSRMTLHRWERVIPLPGKFGVWGTFYSKRRSPDVDAWLVKVKHKLRSTRPRGPYLK
ncbi:hypothetical protein ES703_54696 [subsurface metagenome]